MKSLFSTLKIKRTNRTHYQTRNQAKARCVQLHLAALQYPASSRDAGIREFDRPREIDGLMLRVASSDHGNRSGLRKTFQGCLQ